MYRIVSILMVVLLTPSFVSAHGPSRQKVVKEISVNAPAAAVWEAICDFCSIAAWHPAVVQCDGPGGIEPGTARVLTVGEAGGPQIHEELQKFDAGKMTYKYKITKTDNAVLPVITYSAFLSVADNGDGTSKVTWRGGFYRAYPNNNPPAELNDEAAMTAVTSVYDAGLQGIKALVEGQ